MNALQHFLDTATLDEYLLIPTFVLFGIWVLTLAAWNLLKPREGEDWLSEGNGRPKR